jgi:predicted RNA binding protein with dsRBD fold (UPF0201 family)
LEASAAVSITLSATISPTESPEKVLAAARNVLGDCVYQVEEEGEGRIALRSREMGCLLKIHDQLRDRQVRAAANRLLLRMRDGRRVIMLLNRQAATVGVVALCTSATESPLGPLVMEIECDKPETVIEWLTTH